MRKYRQIKRAGDEEEIEEYINSYLPWLSKVMKGLSNLNNMSGGDSSVVNDSTVQRMIEAYKRITANQEKK